MQESVVCWVRRDCSCDGRRVLPWRAVTKRIYLERTGGSYQLSTYNSSIDRSCVSDNNVAIVSDFLCGVRALTTQHEHGRLTLDSPLNDHTDLSNRRETTRYVRQYDCPNYWRKADCKDHAHEQTV